MKQRLRQGLVAAWVLWQKLLELWNAVAPKANAFIGVQLRRLADQRSHAAHALVDLSHRDFTQ